MSETQYSQAPRLGAFFVLHVKGERVAACDRGGPSPYRQRWRWYVDSSVFPAIAVSSRERAVELAFLYVRRIVRGF